MKVILELTRIVQAAADAETAADQVKSVVNAIHDTMQVDVCSLYLANDSGEMTLVASHGLAQAAIGTAKLPPGTGLVGLVTETRHPVNLAEAASHPAFKHIPGTREEKFRSFCGVPLVRAGAVIGVLVTQSKDARKLSEEEEAFLVTLGTQLALVVANWADWETVGPGSTHTLTGICGAPGIGIGRVHLCDDVDLFSVTDSTTSDIEGTLADWRSLLLEVREDVRREQAALGQVLSHEIAAVFDAYRMLLADPALLTAVERAIGAGHSLPAALKLTIQHYSELFLAMEDPYLRARHEDIRHLGNKLFSSWRNRHADKSSTVSRGSVVLVGRQVSVSDIAAVETQNLGGVICFGGSTLSHTAVLANALGVPAVMGVGEPRGIFEGELVIVDGNLGQALLQPGDAILAEYQQHANSEKEIRGRLLDLRDKAAITTNGDRITLYVNSGLLADLSPGLASGAEGLGLYRTEIPFMMSDTFPSEEEQLHTYRQVMETYRGKPVYMRILDIGGDKPLPYFPIREENPALGWRGIRFCLDNSSLLMSQVRAMLRAAAGMDNLHILLPMVSSLSELTLFNKILDDALEQLLGEGIDATRPPVGVMVEVPAAISQLKLWQHQLDFVSIGSNDLSQYILALDRNNPRVSAAYDHIHPAVLHEVTRIVGIAAELKLPLSLCGEMSSDPAAVVLLVGMGVRTLSMSAAQLPRIKWLIRHIDTETARDLQRQALALPDAAAIRALLDTYLQSLNFPDGSARGDS